MKLVDNIMGKAGFVRTQKLRHARFAQRNFAAAMANRLTADWLNVSGSIDRDIRSGIRMVRDRARDLSKNNDYAKKFTRLLRLNVVGPYGFKLQNKAKDPGGAIDTLANTKIEEAWNDWSRRQNCSVDGKLSLRGIQDVLINRAGCDGEALIRIVRNKQAKYGIQLQLIDADLLDEMKNTKLTNGNYVKMGVEVDKWRRPINYFLRPVTPEQELYGSNAYITTYNWDVLNASELIHGFDQEYPAQTRGISWLVQSMIRLKFLQGWEEAAVVNARVSAAKMGFFKDLPNQVGSAYTGTDQDAAGNTITSAEPGSFEELPHGMDFVPWDPKYPDAMHEMFMRTQLRGISSGLGVAASSLSNDLSDVNYSSIRAGLVEEREQWKLVQQWFTELYLEQIFTVWLESALLSGDLNLPMSKFEKLNKPTFIGRRWAWVDPLKDIQAKIAEIRAGLTTATQVVAEQGDDLEEIYMELQKEKDLAAKYGLEFDRSTATFSQINTADAIAKAQALDEAAMETLRRYEAILKSTNGKGAHHVD